MESYHLKNVGINKITTLKVLKYQKTSPKKCCMDSQTLEKVELIIKCENHCILKTNPLY